MSELPHLADEPQASFSTEAHRYIVVLEQTVATLPARLTAWEAVGTELHARLRQTSPNSSRSHPHPIPPSAPPQPARKASGRKQGAQAGL